METSSVETQFGWWTVEGHSIVIEYSFDILEKIRAEVVDGFNRVRHGGIEVGGVLFGTREHNVVRVLAYRALQCEYALGPSFVLSAGDQARLRDLLRSATNDRRLHNLQPVGWYHSHTRSHIFLSSQDLEIFDTYFPGPLQIALVLRPKPFEATRAGFFFRDVDGYIFSETSYREFTVGATEEASVPAQDETPVTPALPDRRTLPEIPAGIEYAVQDEEPPLPPPSPPPTAPEIPSAVEPAAQDEEPLLPPPPPRLPPPEIPQAFRFPPVPAPWPVEPGQPRRSSTSPWWLAAAAVAVVVIVLAISHRSSDRPSAQQLSLTARDVAGELRIEWDRMAEPIRRAASGSLEVADGQANTSISLDANRLRRGSLTYQRKTEDVTVRLRVRPAGAQSIEEYVRFFGPLHPPPLPKLDEVTDRKQLEFESDLALSKKLLEQKAAQVRRLEQQLKTLGSKSRVRADPPVTRPAPVSLSAQKSMSPSPNAQKVQTGSASVPALQPPPSVESRPITTPNTTSPTVATVLQPASAPRPPRPATSTTNSAVVTTTPAQADRSTKVTNSYAGPVSGRLIWTGRLNKNGVVEINGNHPSMGSLIGHLPGVPVHISVFPADLTPDGITLHTSDSKYASGVAEGPGPQNGWNKTMYTWNPKRAAGITVLEPPGPQNGWKRLVVRSDSSKLSLFVMDWKVNQ
jgi:proteasome lid subunit RPN8/RPN11